jgi:hypothetical protein
MGKLIKLKGETFEMSEDENEFYFTEISDRKIKVDFTISKNKKENQLAEYGLKAFWTEVYS